MMHEEQEWWEDSGQREGVREAEKGHEELCSVWEPITSTPPTTTTWEVDR